ncbi:hydroxypyruvate isomerase family protein [Pelagibacterium sp.]|uniref:hydroxypyruvate isomerase family protein n=1 Tax=Pelagibacterium sp. TaxID=1967288 RepID=UPI003BAD7EA8
MLRFAANLTTMYGALPVLDAIAAAAGDGFEAVECRTVFDYPKEEVRDALARHGVTLVQFNCPMGNMAAGERGLACVPGRDDAFRDSIVPAIEYARALGVGQVNCVAGIPGPGHHDAAEIESLMIENLTYAAPRFADAGVKLQIEPINPVDNKGVFFTRTDQFERIHERVGSDNLYLQYDFYHLQITQGDLLRHFERLQPLINHVQVAGVPNRDEPDNGEVAYSFVLSELERLGYQGWVGCEYVPAGTAAEGLSWLDEYRRSATM